MGCHKHIVWRLGRIIVIALGFAVVLAGLFPVFAQVTTPSPAVEILAIDVTEFPEIGITVRMDNVPTQDAVLPEVYEDGVRQEVQPPSELPRKPVNIGVLLDISGGAYKGTVDRYDARFIDWLKNLLDRAKPNAYQDRLALFMPDASGASLRRDFRDVLPEVVVWEGFWADDHNRVYNLVLNDQFNSIAPPGTELSRLILDAVNAFPEDEAASNQLIVFTGSIDKQGGDNFEDLQAACIARNVRIHAVMVASDVSANRTRMQTIADLCNGVLTDLAEAPAADDPLLRTIIDDWQQQMDLQLRYRTRQPQPREVQVRVSAHDTILEASAPIVLESPPAPPETAIALSASGLEVSAGEPALLNVSWALANYPFRSFTISYTVPAQSDWTAVVLPVGATAQGSVPLEVPAADLQVGANLIEVRIVDELGLENKASTQVLVVAAQPTTTPADGVSGPKPPPEGSLPFPLEAVSILLVGILVFLVGFLFWRAPSVPELLAPADKSTVNVGEEVTLQWKPMRGAAAYRVEITYGSGTPEIHGWQQTAELSLGGVDLDARWRVQARNRFNRVSNWSLVWVILSDDKTTVRAPVESPSLAAARLVRESQQPDLPATISLVDVKGVPRTVVAIGRSNKFADEDALLNDQSVSRTHCRIRYKQGSYFIYDEYGTVGTIVNGQQVNVNGCELHDSDLIRLGEVVFRFEVPDITEPYTDGGGDFNRTEKSGSAADPDRTEPFSSQIST